MRLHELLREIRPTIDLAAVSDAEITGVQDDSRRVLPGNLFIARPGIKVDGNAFAADAITRGAAAVVTQAALPGVSIPQVIVPNAGEIVSALANIFFGRPAESVRVLGVTGTNGKTTTAYLIRHILNTVGKRCGMVGTVEIDDGRQTAEAAMTTPSAVDVAALLAEMRTNACAACAIEVSSHALHQGRTGGVKFAGAGFTNLTGDHLDYHGTMDAYADAKAILFAGLPATAIAAVNADSAYADRMIRDTRARVVRFGIDSAADYRATDSSVTAQGTSFLLTAPDGRTEIHTRLVGRHNIENALCAITLCCEVFGLSVSAVAAALKTAAGAPGRLQPVPSDKPFAVLVDYAHTDDALRNVLTALRPLTKGRLRVVFGCGGDRDRTKRPHGEGGRIVCRPDLRHQRQPTHRECRRHPRRNRCRLQPDGGRAGEH
ncbi:MAG: UDP-N-acetylmuramoyl-L-alanyl-D-glutamate--2,6-diaminopimelate ligase [Tepidisphaeraceae bacterium]